MSSTPRPQNRISADSVAEATGKDWQQWVAILDAWGGLEHTHGEIAAYLVETHQVDGWWAQAITVGYEQERGLRKPGQRSDGTFNANAAKTIGVAAEIVFDLWADENRRAGWFGDEVLSLRTATRPRSLRFDFGEDGSRVQVGLYPKGEHKVAVNVSHEKLSNEQELEVRKAYWRRHLAALKTAAEAYRPM